MEFSNYVKSLRENKKLSQRQLAELANVSNTEISRIETGERKDPSPFILIRIAPHLGVGYLDLYYRCGHIDCSLINNLKGSLNIIKSIENLDIKNMKNNLDDLMKGID